MAQLYLGWMYQTGRGSTQDVEKAEYWFRRAVAADSPKAAYYLATVYWQKHELQQALEWFETSASRGFAPAIYQLGRIYRLGYHVPIDEKKGWEYIERAARKGMCLRAETIGRRGAL
jgi:TPR repeat protein